MYLRIFTLGILITITLSELQTVHEWKYLDFLWLSEEHKENAIRNGQYNFTRLIPSDFAVSKGKFFIILLP